MQLTHDRALEIDEAGQEVLVGLTLPESIFFVGCVQLPPHLLCAGDDFIYQQLKSRHVEERVRRLLLSFRAATPPSA